MDQARADLRAARCTDDAVAECHRRYWLQQAYEKALKAYLVAQVGKRERHEVLLIVRDTILGSHSPLTDFPRGVDLDDLKARLEQAYPDDWQRGLRLVELLRRHAHAFVTNRRGHEALYKLDDTRPSIAARYPSYRYPFFDGGKSVAPAKWRGWTGYQGPEEEVAGAVEELIDAARVAGSLGLR
ncbi:MAG: hypothetical protein ACQEXJ_20760 [Myxococcota bacterium]